MKATIVFCTVVLGSAMMLAQYSVGWSQETVPATPPMFPPDQTLPVPPKAMPPDTPAPPAVEKAPVGSGIPVESYTEPARPVLVQGCLTEEGGNFVLQQDSGSKIVLLGDAVFLAGHVGQQVSVTGSPEIPSGENEGKGSWRGGTNANSEATGNSRAAGLESLRVDALARLANDCGEGR